MAQTYKYKYTNESFSGCDMVASITYSYQVTDDKGKTCTKHNTYTLGELQTISYSIHMEKKPVRAIGNVNAKDYVMGQRTIAGSLVFAVFNRHFAKNIIKDTNGLFKKGQSFLVDELPPFNIVISFANEYGLRSKLVVYGVRLLNEGQVMSVNDVYTENTYQFMATDVEYMNDEMSYSSSMDGIFHQIADSDVEYNKGSEDANEIAKKISEDYDPKKNTKEKIVLSASTKDAGKNKSKGSATLTLSPRQKSGTISVFNNEGKLVSKIKVNGNKDYRLALDAPMTYTAKFSKGNPDKWTCNNRSFFVGAYTESYDNQKYAPLIEAVTHNAIQVYSNEPAHTHICIHEKNSKGKPQKLTSRRHEFGDLKANRTYYIYTCMKNGSFPSPETKVKTLTTFDKPFLLFKQMVYANQRLLLYKDMARYDEVIEEAIALAAKSKKFTSPISIIGNVRKTYESKLKKINESHEKYQEYMAKIHACNELIYLANTIQNKTMAVANKAVAIPTPKHFYNDAYDNIFQFDSNVDTAEYYRRVINQNKKTILVQSAQTVSKAAFKTIDERKNSFRYLGRSGELYYVQALAGNARSQRLEFAELTPAERKERIQNEKNKNKVTETQQKKIEMIVKKNLPTINNELMDRAFLSEQKRISNPKLLDVEVLSIEDGIVTLNTNVKNIISDNSIPFYIAIANKEEVIHDEFLYKHPFNCDTEQVKLEDMDCGLMPNETYAIWIEDGNYNQISNVTTFKMHEKDTPDDRIAFEYEMSSLIGNIEETLSPILPREVFEGMCSTIEYNDDITKCNIIDEMLSYLMYSNISKACMMQALEAIKHYVGYMASSDDILANVSYDDNILSYSSHKDTCMLVMQIGESEVKYRTYKEGQINLSGINEDYVIAVAITEDLNYKSDIIFINTKTGQWEVL